MFAKRAREAAKRHSRIKRTHRAVSAVLEQMEERRLLSAPNAPFALSVTARTGALVVTFEDNASDETGFVVLRNGSAIATLPAAAGIHSVVSYTDFTVAANTTYSYSVFAVTNSTPSSTTGPVSITTGTGGGDGQGFGTTPNAPFGITAAASGPNVVISFLNNSSDDTGFDVVRSRATQGPEIIGTVPASSVVDQKLTFADVSAQPNTTYQYTVFAVDGERQSSIPAAITFTTPNGTPVATPPNGPYNLSATAESNGSVQLTFTDNADDETGFTIERAKNGGTFSDVFSEPASPGVGQTVTFVDPTAAAGTTYKYVVFAVNSAGNSYASNIVTVTASGSNSGDGNPGGVPNAPFNLVGLPGNDETETLSFIDNSLNETGFVIQRSGGSSIGYTAIAILPAAAGKGTTVTYTDTSTTGQGSDVSYSYRVEAINGSVASSFAGPVNVISTYSAVTLPNGQVLSSQIDTSTPSAQAVTVTLYNPNGTIDTTYGNGGTLSIPSDNSDLNIITQLAVEPSGAVVAMIEGGVSSDNPYSETRLVLISTSGQVVTSRLIGFGSANQQRLDFGPPFAISAQGEIFVAGNQLAPDTAESNGPFPLVVDAFNSDLSPVSTFGNNAQVIVDPSVTGTSTPKVTAITPNSDGSVTIIYTNSTGGPFTVTLSSAGQVETAV